MITSISKGRRIVDLDTFQNEMWCHVCNLPLSLKYAMKEKRMGLASVFTVKCSQCQKLQIINTDIKENIDRTYEVNSRLAFGQYFTFLCNTV